MKFSAALTSLDSGLVELIAGDPEVAEAELRRDYEELDRMGESNYRATIAAFLAEALYWQERLEDAEKFAGICREIAAADDLGRRSTGGPFSEGCSRGEGSSIRGGTCEWKPTR